MSEAREGWLSVVRRGRGRLLVVCLAGMAAGGRAQTMANPGFESDTFSVSPGHINANAPITGWTANRGDLAGLNPAGGTNVFANNGTIPQGTRVAFLQGATGATPPSALSTTITGLTPGQAYKLMFRCNVRTTNAAVAGANLRAAIDNSLMLSLSNLVPVTGTNPYRYLAFDFTASAASHTLSLTNDRPAESAALIDDFSIGALTSGWSVAVWTNDATSGVDGSKRYTHAYNFDSTSATATINGVVFRGVAGINPAVAGEMYSAGLGTQYTGADVNSITTNGGGSAVMATRFVYNGYPETLTIGGLVPGVEYLATFYLVGWDTREYARCATFYLGEDRLTVNQDEYGNNLGVRVSCRYVAPSNGMVTVGCMPLRDATIHLSGFSNCENAPDAPAVGSIAPTTQMSAPGATATIRVPVAGQLPLSCQWLKDGTPVDGQTNARIDVAVADATAAGAYALIVSNALGSVTSSAASLAVGWIANPSFEADSFFIPGGYVSANSPISGWTSSQPTRSGLNPVVDGQSALANCGAVPDGRQVAFIQSSGITNNLSTTLAGLTPGQAYALTWRINARASYPKPALHAALDGVSVVDMLLSSNGVAGSANPYRYAAIDFTASAPSHTLTLTNDAANDATALIDDFRMALSSNRWSVAAWNDDASSGADPTRLYTHAYKFAGATDATVNGVRFTGLAGGNPSVPGEFAAAGFANVYFNDVNTVTTNGGGGAVLARDFIVGGPTHTLALSNLVPGVEYLATVYTVGFDAKNYGRAATFNVGEDRLTVNVDHYGNNGGLRVSYRYTAPSNGVFTLTYVPTDWISTFHTYAFSNCELGSTNAPGIYRQPRAIQWVGAGDTVTLSGRFGGQSPVFYQWRKDGVDLAGETNATLSLAAISSAQAGAYSVAVSNDVGVTVSSNAVVEVGLPVANPGFEADAFTGSPGYISNNTPITGWVNSNPGAGINPLTYAGAANNPAYSPFANNGTIPEGRQAAFIQGTGTMSQIVSGFTVGHAYYVKFYENSRSGYAVPSLSVAASGSGGGTVVVPSHTVTAGFYRVVSSLPFTATDTSMTISFVKESGDAVLLDSVAVQEVPNVPPEFIVQPSPSLQWVAVGEAVRLIAGATGGTPLFQQWQRDGADLDAETNTVLDMAAISLGQAGAYRAIASNFFGMATSQVAVVRVGAPFSEIFNTGVDATNGLAAGASTDPHYALVASIDPAHPGPAAVVMNDAYPIGGTAYMTNGPLSKWIAPMLNTLNYGGNVPGLYVYRTTFLLDTVDAAVANISGKWAMDNIGAAILLNGTNTGVAVAGGFTTWTSFAITNGFVPGSNVVDFVISNAPPTGPTGFRAELRGLAVPLAPGLPQILTPPSSLLAQNGGEAFFAVVAAGAGPLRYQWYQGDFPLDGETNRTMRLPLVIKPHEAGYRVVVANESGPVTSAVAVLSVNLPPVPEPDKRAAVTDRATQFNAAKLAANDTDPDGDSVGVVAVGSTSTNGGTASLAAGAVTYTPLAGFSGDDAITYTVSDGRGGQASTNVAIVVGSSAAVGGELSSGTLSPGLFRMGFQGIPGCPYTIESATNMFGPWDPVTNMVTSPAGLLQFEERFAPPLPKARFYRTAYP